MNIYIDESGVLGDRNKFFIIGAIIVKDNIKIKKIIKKNIQSINKQKNKKIEEIHTCTLTFPQKQKILNELGKSNCFEYVYIRVLNNKINKSIKKNIYYNYFITQLLKKICFSAKDNINIIMDQYDIKTTSIDSLENYLQTTAYLKWKLENKISLQHKNSKDVKGIQVSDIITNTVWGRYNYEKTNLYNIIKHTIRYSIFY